MTVLETYISPSNLREKFCELKENDDTTLKNLSKEEPFFLTRKVKNFFTSICTALVFVRSRQNQPTKVRLLLLPNFLVILIVVLWLLSLLSSWKAYQLMATAHSLDEKIPAPSFPMIMHLSIVPFLIIIIWSIFKERLHVLNELKRLLSNND